MSESLEQGGRQDQNKGELESDQETLPQRIRSKNDTG